MASPSLLAHVTNSKFNLGLPLYRVSQDLKRYRMDLGPGTLGTWMSIVGGEKIVPVVNLIRDALFAAPFMHIDETPLQILRSDKATGSDHYVVVRAGGPPGQRIILYDYLASRTTAALKQFFLGPDGPYQGKLVSDGLERYDDIAAELKLQHFGCLTHCRTMFFKARKVSNLPSSRTLANAAIEDYIGPVYRIEGQIKALRAEYEQRGQPLPLETVLQLRQQKSKPILEKFKAWIDELLPEMCIRDRPVIVRAQGAASLASHAKLIGCLSSVRTLLEQIHLVGRIGVVSTRTNLRKQHIQRGLLEHGQAQDL